MTTQNTLGRNLERIILFLYILSACTVLQGQTPKKILIDSTDGSSEKFIKDINLYSDETCNKTLLDIQKAWSENDFFVNTIDEKPENLSVENGCRWLRIVLFNSTFKPNSRFLYFPKGWRNLECYVSSDDNNFTKKNYRNRKEAKLP